MIPSSPVCIHRVPFSSLCITRAVCSGSPQYLFAVNAYADERMPRRHLPFLQRISSNENLARCSNRHDTSLKVHNLRLDVREYLAHRFNALNDRVIRRSLKRDRTLLQVSTRVPA